MCYYNIEENGGKFALAQPSQWHDPDIHGACGRHSAVGAGRAAALLPSISRDF
jgi:hypothetical protein